METWHLMLVYSSKTILFRLNFQKVYTSKNKNSTQQPHQASEGTEEEKKKAEKKVTELNNQMEDLVAELDSVPGLKERLHKKTSMFCVVTSRLHYHMA